jgi:hypothetical protein
MQQASGIAPWRFSIEAIDGAASLESVIDFSNTAASLLTTERSQATLTFNRIINYSSSSSSSHESPKIPDDAGREYARAKLTKSMITQFWMQDGIIFSDTSSPACDYAGIGGVHKIVRASLRSGKSLNHKADCQANAAINGQNSN